MNDPELDQFKSEIHLVHYALERFGYRRDRRESSRACHVLRHDRTNDKIIVRRAPSGHWTYFSVRDDRDHGTIIDFVQRRERGSLGHVREALRSWVGTPRPDPALWSSGGFEAPATRRQPVAARFAAARLARDSVYLASRGLKGETLRHPRFAGTWREDRFGNVLFVHRDDTGDITGYEIKNRGLARFSAGGTKAAWQSHIEAHDRFAVLTEGAIDALSYHQLHPERGAQSRYLSTAGAPGRGQLEILGRLFGQLPEGTTVVAAVDADNAGEKLAARIAEVVRSVGPLRFERHAPRGAKDWNEVLQAKEGAS